MVELYSSAIEYFGGKFTPKQRALYDELRMKCENPSSKIDEEVYVRALNKLNHLDDIVTPQKININGIIGDVKNQIKLTKAENGTLEDRIIPLKNSFVSKVNLDK